MKTSRSARFTPDLLVVGQWWARKRFPQWKKGFKLPMPMELTAWHLANSYILRLALIRRPWDIFPKLAGHLKISLKTVKKLTGNSRNNLIQRKFKREFGSFGNYYPSKTTPEKRPVSYLYWFLFRGGKAGPLMHFLIQNGVVADWRNPKWWFDTGTNTALNNNSFQDVFRLHKIWNNALKKFAYNKAWI